VKTHRGRYQTFYEQVRDCLQGLGQAPVSVPDAVATIRLIELAMQSSAEQRTVTVDTGIKSI
jgi:predicted dehydrogenase